MSAQFFTIFALGIAPSFVWLLFYLKEDPHPEPPRWLIVTFIGGMAMVPIVYFAEKFIQNAIVTLTGKTYGAVSSNALFMFLGIALVEELAKFLIVWLILNKNPIFDEPVDAMIYMITAALGFAASENMVLLVSLERAAVFMQGLSTILLRMIGANFLHTLASGLIGFGWALSSVTKARGRRVWYFCMGIAGATLLHGIFNALIIKFGPAYLFPTTAFLFAAGLLILNDFEILKQIGANQNPNT